MPSCGTPPSFLSADWLCPLSPPPLLPPSPLAFYPCLSSLFCPSASRPLLSATYLRSNLRHSGIQKFRSGSWTSVNIAAIPRKLSCFRADFFAVPPRINCLLEAHLKGILRFLFLGFEKLDTLDISSRRRYCIACTTFTLSLNFDYSM